MTVNEALAAIRAKGSEITDGELWAILNELWTDGFGEGQDVGYLDRSAL